MHFQSQHIEAKVSDSLAKINITQIFKNELDQAVEATYSFPTDPDMVLGSLTIELGDRVVKGKVFEKEKAQEKYDDAIAGGNAAVLVKEKEDKKDLIQMTIGGINPEQEVKVILEFIKQVEIEGGAFCLRIPTSYFIKTSSEISELGMREEQKFGKFGQKLPSKRYDYSFKVDLETSHPITYLSIPNHSKVVKTDKEVGRECPTQVSIDLPEGDSSMLKKDLLVYYRTI